MAITGYLLLRAPDQPRWLTVAFAPALLGHALAGFGLYWDIAWHIDVGRDEQLFTTPHTMILAGLLLLLVSSCASLFVAARDGVRLPRAMIAAAFSSAMAVVGFPLDELWHQARGLDTTLWSPTHILMVGGGGLAVAPLWLALGEAGVRARDGGVRRVMHIMVALTLLGAFSSFTAEYDFGAPQFQLLYQPVIVLLAGALVLTAVRAAAGPGAALAAAAGVLAFRGATMLWLDVGLERTVPRPALFLGVALVVEAVARLRPPERGLLPYALLSGAAVGTVGLATEWAWAAAVAYHPWNAALATEAILVGLVAAVGGALLGTCLATALRDGLPRARPVLLAAGAVLALLALALPSPRTAKMSPQAAISYEREGDEARVRVVIGPPDAPYGAHWWEVLAYQGGGMRIEPLIAGEGSGVYETRGTVPITGNWKVWLRLHRGSDLLGTTLRRPADAEVGEEEIPPREGFVTLELERYSGEPRAGTPDWLGPLVLGGAAALWLGWAVLTVRAGRAARAVLTPPEPAPRSQGGRRKLRQG